MIFAHRDIQAITARGIDCRSIDFKVRPTPISVLTALRTLRRAIKETDPDLVHAQFGTITAFLAILATTRPVVVTYRGSDLNPDVEVSRVRSAVQTLLSELAALRARGIICVSTRLVGRLWWRRERAIVVPSGVDTDLFRPMNRSAARRQLGWAEKAPVIFFSAGVQPITKRLPLAEAAAAAASRILGQTVRLLVLRGDTPPAEVPLLMNAADCLLMTSHIEGSPVVVQEALACNLPIVSVDVGDVAERLVGVEPSFIVAPEANALGAAAAEVIRSGQRSNGRAKAVEELSTHALAARIVAYYRQCLRR